MGKDMVVTELLSFLSELRTGVPYEWMKEENHLNETLKNTDPTVMSLDMSQFMAQNDSKVFRTTDIVHFLWKYDNGAKQSEACRTSHLRRQ